MKGNITPEQQQAARSHMGAWLKERREESGLSQSELARQIGVDQATINKIEAGKWAISVDMIELFLQHYGCSIADIFVLTGIKRKI
jgi:transcriptional regulator with XRE-family HTH domain